MVYSILVILEEPYQFMDANLQFKQIINLLQEVYVIKIHIHQHIII